MKLYTDAFSGVEIISDSYKFTMDFDGVICKVKSRMVVKGNEDVDIGRGNAFGGAEPEEAGGNDNVEKVIDLVDAFMFQDTAFDKPSYEKYFKGYMKKVLTYLKEKKPERVDGFMKGARAFFEWVKDEENFKELSFYTPKDFDTENIIILSRYEGEDAAPTFYFTIDGLKEEKV